MKYYMLLLLSILSFLLKAQEIDDLHTYTFPKAEQLQLEETRPYFVFIHTNWCRYCHGMKTNTFSNPDVIKELNKKFYFIKLNGEAKEDIVFSGHTFKYMATGVHTGVHQLAEALGNIEGTLSYPTIVILNAKNEIIFQHDSFISSNELLRILEKSFE
ncbi:hypothetical protein GCM10022393_32940 [Aquimarina addita]|uniref:Thioredoxin domain-containing protein n=1 Tax=Aquimarina addita TaxID=870485 RepID=A0ABP6UP84_9FLAO